MQNRPNIYIYTYIYLWWNKIWVWWSFWKGLGCQVRHMLQRISHKTLCVWYLCPLSICQEEVPLWGDVKALHGSGTAASANQRGERSSLQIQQQHQRAQQHLFYLENKCLVMHHENALLRCGHSIDNVFLFNLMEKAFVCCDEIGKAVRFTVSRLIAIRTLVQLILTREQNCRPE